MANVSVTPQTFEYVEFDAGEIAAVVSRIADRLGLDDSVAIAVEIDEVVMIPRVETEITPGKVLIKASGGSLEDSRQPRHFTEAGAENLLARLLLQAKDRLDPAFAGAPPDDELTIQQASAWDTYTEGRAERLGFTSRRGRRQYHFRLRHGFSDDIDAVFDRLWAADHLGWDDLTKACEETATYKAALVQA